MPTGNNSTYTITTIYVKELSRCFRTASGRI